MKTVRFKLYYESSNFLISKDFLRLDQLKVTNYQNYANSVQFYYWVRLKEEFENGLIVQKLKQKRISKIDYKSRRINELQNT